MSPLLVPPCFVPMHGGLCGKAAAESVIIRLLCVFGISVRLTGNVSGDEEAMSSDLTQQQENADALPLAQVARRRDLRHRVTLTCSAWAPVRRRSVVSGSEKSPLHDRAQARMQEREVSHCVGTQTTSTLVVKVAGPELVQNRHQTLASRIAAEEKQFSDTKEAPIGFNRISLENFARVAKPVRIGRRTGPNGIGSGGR